MRFLLICLAWAAVSVAAFTQRAQAAGAYFPDRGGKAPICEASKAYVAHRLDHRIRYRKNEVDPTQCKWADSRRALGSGSSRGSLVSVGSYPIQFGMGNVYETEKHEFQNPPKDPKGSRTERHHDPQAGRDGYWSYAQSSIKGPFKAVFGVCRPQHDRGILDITIVKQEGRHRTLKGVSVADMHRLFKSFCNRF